LLQITPQIQIAESELQFTYARSSGPGGQNVNKVNSKAVLRWRPGESALPAPVRARFLARHGGQLTTEGDLIVASQRYRDQGRNIDDCREKLAALIRAVAVPPKRRRPTKPTKASQERRIASKQVRSQRKAGRSTRFDRDP
jgi:ribosome-associated protein